MRMNLDEYLRQPNRTAKQLAETIGVPQALISQWRRKVRPVPAERCPAIERATNGAVTCEELRPDVDWAVLRARQRPDWPAESEMTEEAA